MEDVSFVIPAYNEENSIGHLLDTIKFLYPSSEIIVVDNNSTDRTALIAKKHGVIVVFEKKQGKAHAMRKGFKYVKSKFIIMLDADNTYDPLDAQSLVEPLIKDSVDLVLGSRFKGFKEKGAISKTNLLGNRILSFTASLFYHPISDVCTGYWAFKEDVINYLLDIGIDSSGFEMEAEMFAKLANNNFKIKEVPISYRCRNDKPKLNSMKDGWKIFRTLINLRYFNDTNEF